MQVSTYALPHLYQQGITLDNITPKEEPPLNDRIIKYITERKRIPLEKLQTKNRKRERVYVRQLIMYVLKNRTELSLKAIGKLFGGRDHTTVLHSIQAMKDYMDTEPDKRWEVEFLIKYPY